MTRSRKATSAAALAQSLASRDCVLSLARRHPFLPPPPPKKCCNTRGPASAGPLLPCNVLMHSTYSQARLPSAKPPSPLASAHSPLLKLSTRLERLPPGQAGFAEPLSPCASMCASTHPQRSRSGPVQSHRNGRTRPILHKRACPTACCYMLRLYYDGLLFLHATTQLLKENVERTRTWCREGVHLVNDWEDGSQYR